jgi:hypothetical protein
MKCFRCGKQMIRYDEFTWQCNPPCNTYSEVKIKRKKPQRSELPLVCRCKFPKNYNNVCGLCGKLIK